MNEKDIMWANGLNEVRMENRHDIVKGRRKKIWAFFNWAQIATLLLVDLERRWFFFSIFFQRGERK